LGDTYRSGIYWVNERKDTLANTIRYRVYRPIRIDDMYWVDEWNDRYDTGCIGPYHPSLLVTD